MKKEIVIFDLYDTVLSDDYKIRKPSKKFFEVAIDYINRGKNEIIYIGNDYKTDMEGASSCSLDAIWLNTKHLENTGAVKCAEVDNFKEVLKYIID